MLDSQPMRSKRRPKKKTSSAEKSNGDKIVFTRFPQTMVTMLDERVRMEIQKLLSSGGIVTRITRSDVIRQLVAEGLVPKQERGPEPQKG